MSGRGHGNCHLFSVQPWKVHGMSGSSLTLLGTSLGCEYSLVHGLCMVHPGMKGENRDVCACVCVCMKKREKENPND